MGPQDDDPGTDGVGKKRHWRAWDTFQACLVLALLALLVNMIVAAILYLLHGGLDTADADRLLRGLYWGTYPLVFLGLGALAWHLVRFYRGDHAP